MRLANSVEFLEQSKLRFLTETEVDEINEEIIALESQIDSLEWRRRTLLEWMNYRAWCEHDIVLDLIDVDLDRTEVIEYCKHCLFVPIR